MLQKAKLQCFFALYFPPFYHLFWSLHGICVPTQWQWYAARFRWFPPNVVHLQGFLLPSTMFKCVYQLLNLLFFITIGQSVHNSHSDVPVFPLWLWAQSFKVQFASGQSVLIGHKDVLHFIPLYQKKRWWLHAKKLFVEKGINQDIVLKMYSLLPFMVQMWLFVLKK